MSFWIERYEDNEDDEDDEDDECCRPAVNVNTLLDPGMQPPHKMKRVDPDYLKCSDQHIAGAIGLSGPNIHLPPTWGQKKGEIA